MDSREVFPNAEEVAEEHDPHRQADGSIRLVLTIDEAAQRLGIGYSLMAALVRSGDVESVRIGRLRRIPVDALSTYVQSLRKPTPDEAA